MGNKSKNLRIMWFKDRIINTVRNKEFEVEGYAGNIQEKKKRNSMMGRRPVMVQNGNLKG